MITEFDLPAPKSDPLESRWGPDGHLGFTKELANKIGRMTPEGVFTESGMARRLLQFRCSLLGRPRRCGGRRTAFKFGHRRPESAHPGAWPERSDLHSQALNQDRYWHTPR